jgi:hypothetical protein
MIQNRYLRTTTSNGIVYVVVETGAAANNQAAVVESRASASVRGLELLVLGGFVAALGLVGGLMVLL